MIMLRSHHYLELTYQIVRFLLNSGGRKAEGAIREQLGALELAVSDWLDTKDMPSRDRLRATVFDLVETSLEESLIDQALSQIEMMLGLHAGTAANGVVRRVELASARSPSA